MSLSIIRSADFEDIPIDRVAEYWDGRPCNIRHSPRPVGTREYFDEVEARKYFVEPHIVRFAEFPRWAGRRVLEIGCGIGTDTISFARHGAHVTAVDVSARSIDVARRRAEVYGLQDSIRFFSGDAEQLSAFVPVEPYDLVYSFGVIHHTPHPSRLIDQIRQYTRPGSIVKIMVYHRISWKVLWILVKYGRGWSRDVTQLVAEYSEAQTGCPITYTYSPREVVQLLRGIAIRELWVDHIFPYRILDYVQYRYVKEWYFRWIPPQLFRQLERRFGWHLCVTAEVR